MDQLPSAAEWKAICPTHVDLYKQELLKRMNEKPHGLMWDIPINADSAPEQLAVAEFEQYLSEKGYNANRMEHPFGGECISVINPAKLAT